MRHCCTAKRSRSNESGDTGDLAHKPYALALRYDAAPALHATLETASATARLKDGKLELWLASQAPEAARRAAAEAAGVRERDTVLYPMPAGGSFDRRLEHDHAIEAAILARETGQAGAADMVALAGAHRRMAAHPGRRCAGRQGRPGRRDHRLESAARHARQQPTNSAAACSLVTRLPRPWRTAKAKATCWPWKARRPLMPFPT